MRFASLVCAWLLLLLLCGALGCGSDIAPPKVPPKTQAAMAFDADAVDVTVDWKATPPDPDAPPAFVRLTSSDGSGLRLASIHARAVLYGPIAFTELMVTFEETERRSREGTFSIALPERAAVSRFAMRLPNGWQEAEVVERQQARKTYESFLHRNVDPALFDKSPGNVFHGRVFPILPGERKQILISWTEEMPDAAEPYRFALRGLPELDVVDVQLLVPSQKKAFVLQRRDWTPDRDFNLVPPKGMPDAVRAGRLAIARVGTPAPARAPALPTDSLAVVIDSSASQVSSFQKTVGKVERAVAALAAKSVHVACFDQEVAPLASIAEAAKRRPSGGSNLVEALRWIKTTGAKRALLVTDGLATAGPTDPQDILTEAAALKAAGVERIDTLSVGERRNESLLRSIAAFGVSQPKASGAPEGGMVYLDVEPDKPVRLTLDGGAARELAAIEAPVPLVERAAARNQIEQLTLARNAPGIAEAERERLAKQIVELSVRHRVLSEMTSMLVLETNADYDRFKIPRNALTDVLTVGPRGVTTKHRDEPVFFADPSGVAPLVDPGPVPNFDSDRDGILDDIDACPREPGMQDADPRKNGCPRFVRILGSEIIILDRIEFKDGSTEIRPESKPILEAVATVMKEHPEFTKVAVEGHTDNIGSAAANKRMSKARADAVVFALVKLGVDAKRLEARGFGDTRPIEDNKTAEGRAKNRRVMFQILEGGERSSARPTIPLPKGPPLFGELKEVEGLLERGQLDEALARARSFRDRDPDDILGPVAEGRALAALGRHREAARAYGSILDLATKPEHRRAAAGLLESLSREHPPALDLAIQTYREVAKERPDQPSSHRLLSLALARAGRTQEAFDVSLAAFTAKAFDAGRYPGAKDLFRLDLETIARSADATLRTKLATQLRSVGVKVAARAKASGYVVVTWETDASDVDLLLVRTDTEWKTPRFDPNDGYGPEFVAFEPTEKVSLSVALTRKGPSGYAFGKASIVYQEAAGSLRFEDRPFVIMNDQASTSLGELR